MVVEFVVVGVFLLFCEAIFSWQFEAGQNDVVSGFVFKVVIEVRSTHLCFDKPTPVLFVVGSPYFWWQENPTNHINVDSEYPYH